MIKLRCSKGAVWVRQNQKPWEAFTEKILSFIGSGFSFVVHHQATEGMIHMDSTDGILYYDQKSGPEIEVHAPESYLMVFASNRPYSKMYPDADEPSTSSGES